MSCVVCRVAVCIYCGKFYPVEASSCPSCGKEVSTKTCIYRGEFL